MAPDEGQKGFSAGAPRIAIKARAVVLSDGTRLEVRQLLDDRWRTALSLRGRTARYTERVHALILFLARLRAGRLTVEGSDDGWAPYDCIARLPGWEQCVDRQRLRETLLHELDLVTGRFFQRSTLDGQPRIRIAQPPETIALDEDPAEASPRRDEQAGAGAAWPATSSRFEWTALCSLAATPPLAIPPLEDAVWSKPHDFPDGLAAAVRSWLSRLEISADARVVHRAYLDFPDDNEVCFPLTEAKTLVVFRYDAVSPRWGDALEQLMRYVSDQTRRFAAISDTIEEGLIMASPAIRQAFARVVSAAERGARLMLIGPTGSGKDGLARCYHRHTGRAGPLVSRNCSLFSRELLRGELFGAEQGAFTGAVRRIVGAVEQADGGTLFLDEIGDMPVELQSQLLSFLDHGEYTRIGAAGPPRRADVRIVCATNRDLRESVAHSQFRADLWYRLSGEIVAVPALRDRRPDIEAYLQARRSARGISVWDRLTPEAASMIFEHAWRGNFRELAHFADRFGEDDARIDGEACRRALAGVALDAPCSTPRATPIEQGPSSKWGALAERAAEAFAGDLGHEMRSWDDVKGYLEHYLKPLLFAHLSGADAEREAVEPGQLARRIDADRGTAYKQLARYRERFRR